MKYPRLQKRTVQDFIKLARAWRVVLVSGAYEDFLSDWTPWKGFTPKWEIKRELVLDRYTKEIAEKGIPLWVTIDDSLYPSPKHLSMIMWGYSPDAARIGNVKRRLVQKKPNELPKRP